MISVNSLSGGRTSSYLAIHYPADLEIFALCCPEVLPKRIVKKLMLNQRKNEEDEKTTYCSAISITDKLLRYRKKE